MRPLSHSSISMYMECPQKYKFKYVDRLPEKPKHYFAFGQSVHKALEFFYGSGLLTPPSLREVLDYLHGHWVREGYKDDAQEAAYKAEGDRILGDFHRLHAASYRPPFFVEYGFNLKVDGVPVTGKVDRIDKLEDGRLAIVDYKTGKAFDQDRVREDAQLTMYQMAVEEALGLKVASLTFYHLPSQTPLTAEPHSEEQVDGLRRRIVGVADGIKNKAFDPRPEEWKCRMCDFRPHCPVFRHQYVTHQAGSSQAHPGTLQEPPVLAPEKSEDEVLADLVDRFGRTKDEVHELEATLEDLREEITAILRKKGYLRAFGASYEVGWHREDHWEFPDRQAVVEALKKLGLFDRVLKPSAPEVQKVMKDPSLDPAARRELETLGRKVESTTLRVRKVESA